MKIAILGLGKTGNAVSEVASSRGHQIFTIDPSNPRADAPVITPENIKNSDICIDFTHPEVVIENIKFVAQCHKPIVVGTTGWYQYLPEVTKIVCNGSGALLYASNFSLGVLIYNQILQAAAKIINKFDDYDIAGVETHHNQKADSPSGTALTISKILLDNISRKSKIVNSLENRKIASDELLFTSVRSGWAPGTHEVLFDSQADTISLKHTARNRSGFALGAVMAAEWVLGKRGVFTVDDFFNDILKD